MYLFVRSLKYITVVMSNYHATHDNEEVLIFVPFEEYFACSSQFCALVVTLTNKSTTMF